MATEIFFGPGGVRIVRTVPDPNPDDVPDEDVLILRRVLFAVAQRTGLTPTEVRQMFRAAKRAVD